MGPSPGAPSNQFGQVIRSRAMTPRGVFILFTIDAQQGEWLALQAFNELALVRDQRHAGATPRSPENHHDDLALIVA